MRVINFSFRSFVALFLSANIVFAASQDSQQTIGVVVNSDAATPTLAVLPTFTVSSAGTIVLSWTTATPQLTTGNFVERAPDALFSSGVASSGWLGAVTTYSPTGHSHDAEYCFRVRARNILNVESDWSTVRCTTMLIPAQMTPEQVAGIDASAAQQIAASPSTPSATLEEIAATFPNNSTIAVELINNPNTPTQVVNDLIGSQIVDPAVALAAAQNPSMSDAVLAAIVAQHPNSPAILSAVAANENASSATLDAIPLLDAAVAAAVAANPNTPAGVLQEIQNSFGSNSGVALPLAQNPNTPDSVLVDIIADHPGSSPILSAVASNGNASSATLDSIPLIDSTVAAAVAANSNTPSGALAEIVDAFINNPTVMDQVAQNPNTSAGDLSDIHTAYPNDPDISESVAANPNTPSAVIQDIAQAFPTNPGVAAGIAGNPNTTTAILDQLIAAFPADTTVLAAAAGNDNLSRAAFETLATIASPGVRAELIANPNLPSDIRATFGTAPSMSTFTITDVASNDVSVNLVAPPMTVAGATKFGYFVLPAESTVVAPLLYQYLSSTPTDLAPSASAVLTAPLDSIVVVYALNSANIVFAYAVLTVDSIIADGAGVMATKTTDMSRWNSSAAMASRLTKSVAAATMQLIGEVTGSPSALSSLDANSEVVLFRRSVQLTPLTAAATSSTAFNTAAAATVALRDPMIIIPSGTPDAATSRTLIALPARTLLRGASSASLAAVTLSPVQLKSANEISQAQNAFGSVALVKAGLSIPKSGANTIYFVDAAGAEVYADVCMPGTSASFGISDASQVRVFSSPNGGTYTEDFSIRNKQFTSGGSFCFATNHFSHFLATTNVPQSAGMISSPESAPTQSPVPAPESPLPQSPSPESQAPAPATPAPAPESPAPTQDSEQPVGEPESSPDLAAPETAPSTPAPSTPENPATVVVDSGAKLAPNQSIDSINTVLGAATSSLMQQQETVQAQQQAAIANLQQQTKQVVEQAASQAGLQQAALIQSIDSRFDQIAANPNIDPELTKQLLTLFNNLDFSQESRLTDEKLASIARTLDAIATLQSEASTAAALRSAANTLVQAGFTLDQVISAERITAITATTEYTLTEIRRLVDQNVIQLVIGPDGSIIATEKTAGMRDSDGDGLSDILEAQLGSNPFNADSDGDGITDSDEVLIFLTDPLVVTDRALIPTRITNLSEGTTFTAARPVLRGTAASGIEEVVVVAVDALGVRTELGSVQPDAENKWLLAPEVGLAEGQYRFVLEVEGAEVYSASATIDLANALPAPELFIDAGNQTDSGLIFNETQPTFAGNTFYGSTVIANFQSILTSSSVIADNPSGDFEVRPPRPLAPGDHTLTLYSELPDGTRSESVIIRFRIDPYFTISEVPLNAVVTFARSSFGFALMLLLFNAGIAGYTYYPELRRYGRRQLARWS